MIHLVCFLIRKLCSSISARKRPELEFTNRFRLVNPICDPQHSQQVFCFLIDRASFFRKMMNREDVVVVCPTSFVMYEHTNSLKGYGPIWLPIEPLPPVFYPASDSPED